MNEVATRPRETVIQSNAISRGIYTCSPLARKLIAYCILKIDYYPQKVENKTVETLHHFKSCFPISEFIKKLGISKGSNTYAQVKRAVEELTTSVIQVENTEEKYKAYTWFSSADYDKKKDLIELEFNQQIGFAIIEWKEKKQYSAMKIKTIGEIQSFYALRFFEIACSWYNAKGRYGNERNSWKFTLTVDEIKKMFKIDKDAYKERMNNFITKVIKNPIDELNRVNNDFSIEYSKIIENHKTVGFTFTCTECDVLKISSDDSDSVKEEKKVLNDEAREMEYYKMKYPSQWEAAIKLAEAQSELPFDFAAATEARAVSILREQGLD